MEVQPDVTFAKSGLQISSCCLINFNTLEECLEIARPKALVVASLNDLYEDSWPVLDRLCEYLQEISIVIVVNEYLQLLQGCQVLLDLDFRVSQALSEQIIITVRNVEKFLSSGSQVCDGFDDVV